jgi:hypothetical protein
MAARSEWSHKISILPVPGLDYAKDTRRGRSALVPRNGPPARRNGVLEAAPMSRNANNVQCQAI